ncbi:MAG: sirohydrochlorin chelatase, partial [Devosia sp.]|nr:sirohydrochlorin chelatase [Devosia sp.]
VKRIYAAAGEAQARHADIDILCAPYLNDHPLVIDTFIDRMGEMLVGQNLMNCAMCKYREQVLGFEAEVGLAQESHHHHVEGIGGGLENCPCGGDCDSSCRDEAFCKAHGLPWTPVHAHHHHDHALLVKQPAPASFGGPHHHDHPHDHDHHHHPYPHADHPLGPVTLPKVPGKLAQKERQR